MFEIKKISIDYFDTIKQSIDDNDQRIGFGKTKIGKEDYLKFTEKILKSNAYQTYGYFLDNELISYISNFNFPNLPYHGFTNFKVIKKFNFYNGTDNGMWRLTVHIASLKEQENYYSFYVARTVKSAKLAERIHISSKRNFPQFYEKYIYTIEEFIPPKTPSKYEYFNKALLMDKVFDEEFLIYKFTCKEEYRNFKNI
jgi:hypothetical protein